MEKLEEMAVEIFEQQKKVIMLQNTMISALETMNEEAVRTAMPYFERESYKLDRLVINFDDRTGINMDAGFREKFYDIKQKLEVRYGAV